MAAATHIEGTVSPRRTDASVAGYAVEVRLVEAIRDEAQRVPLLVPVSGTARLTDDGAFGFDVGGSGTPQGPVQVLVSAPNGTAVVTRELEVEELAEPLLLDVDTLARFEIEPSDDPARGERLRLGGMVIDERGRKMQPGLPVVIWGVDRHDEGTPEPPARPLVISETQTGGRFAGDCVADVLERAFGRVSGGPPIAVALDPDDRLVREILLVVDLDEVLDGDEQDDCCGGTPPRAPDPDDLTANPEGFSQDLGRGCVDLTTPSRVLEEFSYFKVVRTTEPKVKGVTLGERRLVPDHLVADLLGVSLATQALGRARSSSLAKLPATLALDATAAARLVRSDRPPSVAEVGRTAWLSELDHTRELIDAGLRTDSGRTVLDADDAVDWDYTPTVHLAIDIAFGHLLQYREVWRADGYSLGDLLYSLPLAPNQRRQIAVLDWDRRSTSAREERLEYEEELDALLARDRDVREIVGTDLHEETSAGSRNTTWGAAGGIGAGFIGSGFGIFGGVAGGGSGSDSRAWQRSARTFSADTLQSLRDRVSQRSSSLRSERSSVVQSVTQGETVRAETETVANYNRCHAMTVEYFEVLRHLLVTHELADVQECLFLPLPITAFDRGKVLWLREPLRRFLKDAGLRGGFEAIERIADNWEGYDYPVARYSEEAPETVEGEMRISFVLPRPRDDEDGKFQVDMWRPFAPLLNGDALELFTAKLNERAARERDRVFREEIAPGIAQELVARLRFAFVAADGGEIDVPIDATLVSRYAESQPLYVTLNPAGGVPPVPREDIAHVKLYYDGDPLPPDAQVVVHSSRMRYSSAHLTALLYDDPRVLDDLRAGDSVVIAAPVSRAELRNPREEDRQLADRLVAHLNENLEHYCEAAWLGLGDEKRFMLLDAVIVPGTGGKSVASVCSNEVIGIVGNSLVLPLAPGQRLDPTLDDIEGDVQGDGERVELRDAYATPPSPPLRVSIPTRGVYAEAVAGECDACEHIDDTRYWRWSTDGLLAPPEITPVSTETRAADEPDVTPTPLPAPLVSIQNAPEVPDPFGLSAAFGLLSKPELFRDVTGLEGTQRNAGAAFQTALSAASALGGEAAKLASQQELGRNAERMLDRIDQARADDLLSPATASELASSALKGLIGESRPAAEAPTADKTVDKVIDQAAQSDRADITVSTPSETVDVSFEDDGPKVGSGTVGHLFDDPDRDHVWVTQPVLVERIPGDLNPFVLDTYDLLEFFLHTPPLPGEERPPTLEQLVARGLVRRTGNRFQLRRELRIVHPADPARPNVISGRGRLPVAVLVHGNHAAWGTTPPTANHEGYAYLQEELAQHGIVSISVDTNAANTMGSLIAMRAEMIMGALDRLRALAQNPRSPFHNRLDFERVGLMGHSRGGDAVVRAAQINRGRTGAPTQFGIRAVCSLAPTDFTGTTATPRVLSRDDTPFYAVVYGALDGDVAGWQGAESFGGTGFRHYDRAQTNKAMVFIDHANHNRFNTVWRNDTTGGDDSGMDVADDSRLLDPAEHRQLAREYIGGMFRWRLRDELPQRGLFDGSRANTLGAGASLQWSFGERVEVIDDLEDQLRPRIVKGAFIDNFSDVTIGARDLGAETNHQTVVLAVEPGGANPPTPALQLGLVGAQRDWSTFDFLTFRVCADFDLTDQTTIDADRLPEFDVVITDGTPAAGTAGVSSATLASPQAPRRPVFHNAIERHRDAAGTLVETPENCTVLRLETLAIPIATLSGIDPSNVDSIAINPPADFPRHMFFDSFELVQRDSRP